MTMPKAKIHMKGKKSKNHPMQRKYRIGSRKSGVGGHSMSVDALLNVLEHNPHPKALGKVKTVLALRGVKI
jgi:hypothetical protein